MTHLLKESASVEDDQTVNAFMFTAEDFRTISKILYEEAGIYLPDSKSALVYSRLTKRLRSLGLECFRDYCALIVNKSQVDERQRMIAALTTNVTKFFREPHHFEHLRRHVLERRVDDVRRGGRLRIWSAACSDGREPYSIAMTILAAIPDAGRLDVRVLATDIDPNMIETGSKGVYDNQAMEGVSDSLRRQWFEPVVGEKAWRVGSALADLVSFRRLNLVGPWPMKGRFDAIFCRNVVIYFEERTQQEVWRRFLSTMTPNGRLYIGHSERVSGPVAEHYDADGVTTYKLASGAAR